jgi:LDH2 family malate/lactate/ureidoglycolate dehydrogenase
VDFLEPAPDQPGPGLGHALGATAIEALMPMEEYNRRVERWAERILAAETAPDQPPLLLHGMPEWASRARRLEQGIPYTEARNLGLRNLALELGLDTIDESPPNLR